MKSACGLLALFAIAGYGCGSTEDDTPGKDGVDFCQFDPAGACSGDCAFEPPADVDCQSACQHIVDVCDSGCAGDCEAINTDPTLCAAACEETKAQRCVNLIFGCYDENSTCDSVGNCVASGG
jgi:hypothetical protein